ncbi:cytochrome c biogenesis protein ResB [Thermodesulfobacteriota bacterium]
MSAKKKNVGIFDRIWDWLCSLKVNVIILILLALTCIFGTVIPQNAEPEVYLRFAGPEWYKFFQATDLDNMYHAWWFVSLLGLLCVTITCCSIDKFPVVWRFVVKPKKDLDDKQVKYIPLKETLLVKGSAENVTQKYRDFLSKFVTMSDLTEIDGTRHLFAQTGLWTRFGVYVTHLSLLIIIIGALIGVYWGEKGYVRINEFTSTSDYYSRKTEDMQPLGFTLRCNSYDTTYYEGTGQPKEYRSSITVIDNGKEMFTQEVLVNHTLQYKGFTFYQSNYGSVSEGKEGYFYSIIDIVQKSDDAPLAKNSLLYSNEEVTIPGTSDKIKLIAYKEDRQYGPMAGFKVIKADGTENTFWTYQRFPQKEDERKGDYKIVVRKVKEYQYTGFQIAMDPGVWTVYTGCGLMIIGTLIAFFFSHKRFWIRVDEADDKGKVKVTFASIHANNEKNYVPG